MLRLHLSLLWAAAARPALDRPNFVMLFVDDMGYGDTGFSGNATVSTPHIDDLAFNGKILTTWYSGCPICTGARAALMTGRQFPRTGLPGGIGPVVKDGLPLSETTVAEQLKKADYATAAVGKWHLGQRQVYLPANRGFDHYLGIPFSNDMGYTRMSSCPGEDPRRTLRRAEVNGSSWNWKPYYEAGYLRAEDVEEAQRDVAALWAPLIRQEHKETRVLEQPADLTTLSAKYSNFAVDFIHQNKNKPFFLYMPFSHVHTVLTNSEHGKQYSGCRFRRRKHSFMEAIEETDWMVGKIHKALQDAGIEENTLILFTGDNGPWMIQGHDAGSTGILEGKFSGYWNVGKGSTWEGGIRSASFAYWKGQIEPHSRSSEIISSMDVFPTLSKLARVELNASRLYDGRDMSEVILQKHGRSRHEFLFFYGGCANSIPDKLERNGPAAVRYGRWKAHFCTGPGLGGCKDCHHTNYKIPLLFDVVDDPGEATPLNPSSDNGRPQENGLPADPQAAEALERIIAAYKTEKATFTYGEQMPEPLSPGEEWSELGICCSSRKKYCHCENPGQMYRKTRAAPTRGGFLSIGTERYHDAYHDAVPSRE